MTIPDLSQAPDLSLFLLAFALAIIVLVVVLDPVWVVLKWMLSLLFRVTGIALVTYLIFKLLTEVEGQSRGLSTQLLLARIRLTTRVVE